MTIPFLLFFMACFFSFYFYVCLLLFTIYLFLRSWFVFLASKCELSILYILLMFNDLDSKNTFTVTITFLDVFNNSKAPHIWMWVHLRIYVQAFSLVPISITSFLHLVFMSFQVSICNRYMLLELGFGENVIIVLLSHISLNILS